MVFKIFGANSISKTINNQNEYLNHARYLENFCFQNSQAHTLACDVFAQKGSRYKLASVSLSIVVLFFAASQSTVILFGKHINFGLPIELVYVGIVGLCSLFVVILSTAQYLLNYDQRRIDSHQASSLYLNLARKIQRLILANEINDERLHSLNRELRYLSRYDAKVPFEIRVENISRPDL